VWLGGIRDRKKTPLRTLPTGMRARANNRMASMERLVVPRLQFRVPFHGMMQTSGGQTCARFSNFDSFLF